MRGTFTPKRRKVHAVMRDESATTLCGREIKPGWLRSPFLPPFACKTCNKILRNGTSAQPHAAGDGA